MSAHYALGSVVWFGDMRCATKLIAEGTKEACEELAKIAKHPSEPNDPPVLHAIMAVVPRSEWDEMIMRMIRTDLADAGLTP